MHTAIGCPAYLCLHGTYLTYITDCHSVLWGSGLNAVDSVNRQWPSKYVIQFRNVIVYIAGNTAT